MDSSRKERDRVRDTIVSLFNRGLSNEEVAHEVGRGDSPFVEKAGRPATVADLVGIIRDSIYDSMGLK